MRRVLRTADGQQPGSPRNREMVGDRLFGQSGLLAMPGQLHIGDDPFMTLKDIISAICKGGPTVLQIRAERRHGPQVLQGLGHGPMEVRAPHRVQALVDIVLEQVVPEAIARKAAHPRRTARRGWEPSHPAQALRLHQAMLLAQRPAQRLEHLLLISLQHPRGHLRVELVSLHAGRREKLLLLAGQPRDVRGDNRFHPLGETVPVQRGSLHPWGLARVRVPVGGIPDEIPALLQAAPQLDGEQGVSPRLPVERLSKCSAQAIGLAIHQGIHKSPPLGLSQVHLVLLPQPRQLQQNRLQRVRLALSPHRHLFRPIGRQDEDPLPGQPPPQVEKQTDRRGVRPLQVIQGQEQGPRPRHRLEHAAELVKKVGLGGGPHTVAQHLSNSRRPGRAVR